MELGVWLPVAALLVGGCWVAGVLAPPPSSDEGSGVVGRELKLLLKVGRRRDVREGEGGSGVGGRP